MSKINITAGTRNGSYFALATYDTDENIVVIKAGSQWDNNKCNWKQEKRAELLSAGYVSKDGKFLCDYELPHNTHDRYTPLSPAIEILRGDRSDYKQYWKLENGTKLSHYLAEHGVTRRIKTPKGGMRTIFVPQSDRNIIFESATETQNSSAQADKIETNILKPYLGKNTIFYGVPGCGKSYKVKELLGADGEGSKVPEAQCKRVLFHPEYSYSDFVGQVMPQTEGERIEYKFAPGPFVEILKDAYDHPRKEYFLIIEEINRGNAPAIFGDLFQLLDRRPKKSGEEEGAKPGESEYGIYNRDILGVLNEGREEPLKEVKIPANLTLFATMNTCDQNVFTLDTAFKRRWRMQRIKNMFYADKEPFVCVIGQSGGKIGERGIIWKEFAEAVNKDILLNCNDGTAAEDKLLGAYFVNEEEIADAQVFAEKVLMYLREDVARYDKSQLFDAKYPTLDAVIDGFVRGENVFSPACGNIKALYDRVPDTATPSEEE